jgi:hypothetical protein
MKGVISTARAKSSEAAEAASTWYCWRSASGVVSASGRTSKAMG